jgi:hypothetical protein
LIHQQRTRRDRDHQQRGRADEDHRWIRDR